MDSVFTPLAFQSPFQNERAIIPIREVVGWMDSIERASLEGVAVSLGLHGNALQRRAFTLIREGGVTALRDLRWPAQQSLAAALRSLWRQGWQRGAGDGREAIRRAISAAARRQAIQARSARRFDELSGQTLRQVGEAIKPRRGNAVPDAAIRAIERRALDIAGDFARDTLNDVRRDLSSFLQADGINDSFTRKELQDLIQERLGVSLSRAETIIRTELTAAYNAGRLESFRESRLVEYVRFLAITDNRTTEICLSRNGLLWPIDAREVGDNTPPLHFRCRSILSPVMPRVNPTHRRWVEDPARDGRRYSTVPLKVYVERSQSERRGSIVALPEGWNLGLI